jgi:hypothetical protein
MIVRLLKKSLWYTFLIHIALFIAFMVGAIINKKGDTYLADAIYFNFLFLQFVPVTFGGVFLIILIFHWLKGANNR